MALGSLPVVVGALLFEPIIDPGALSLQAVLAMVYVVAFPMWFCHWAWFSAVEIFPASIAAIGTLVHPGDRGDQQYFGVGRGAWDLQNGVLWYWWWPPLTVVMMGQRNAKKERRGIADADQGDRCRTYQRDSPGPVHDRHH